MNFDSFTVEVLPFLSSFSDPPPPPQQVHHFITCIYNFITVSLSLLVSSLSLNVFNFNPHLMAQLLLYLFSLLAFNLYHFISLLDYLFNLQQFSKYKRYFFGFIRGLKRLTLAICRFTWFNLIMGHCIFGILNQNILDNALVHSFYGLTSGLV